MARQDSTTYEGYFNSSSSGLYKDQTANEIEAIDLRTHVTNTKDSFWNNATDMLKKVSTSGTDTYTISDTVFPAYSDGLVVHAKFGNASTGACTLNINSKGAKKVYIDASTQAGSGDIPANFIGILVYDSSLDSAAGGFLILNKPGINGGTP